MHVLNEMQLGFVSGGVIKGTDTGGQSTNPNSDNDGKYTFDDYLYVYSFLLGAGVAFGGSALAMPTGAGVVGMLGTIAAAGETYASMTPDRQRLTQSTLQAAGPTTGLLGTALEIADPH